MRNCVYMTCVVLVLLVLGGCGGSDDDGASKRTTVAVIPKGTTHEFWKAVHAGAEKAGEEFGVDILWKGPLKEDDREAQISLVENIITLGVDGIVLAPLDDAALRAPVNEAVDSGIPVVVFDSGLKGDNYVSFVATDNLKAGQLAGDYMAEILGANGRVVVLRYSEGSDSTTKRENGFLKALTRYEGIEVVSSNQYAGVTVESAMKAAENLLTKFSGAGGGVEIDGIFCATEPTTQGILRALENMGMAGKIKFVGFDFSDKMIAALREGKLDGFVVQDPMNIGYLAVKTMVGHLNGEQVKNRIDTGSRLINSENLDEPEIQKLLNPEVDKWLE